MMKRVREAGEWLEKSYRRADYKLDAFPSLASQAIVDFDLIETLSIESVLSAGLRHECLPRQLLGGASPFAQPPITLYWHPQFVIDAYLWTTGTTSIHDHKFTGAFAVVSGSSLHASYEFIERERFGESIWVGELKQDYIEYLRPGNVRQILGGNSLSIRYST